MYNTSSVFQDLHLQNAILMTDTLNHSVEAFCPWDQSGSFTVPAVSFNHFGLGQWSPTLTCLANPETGGGACQTRPTLPSSGKNIYCAISYSKHGYACKAV